MSTKIYNGYIFQTKDFFKLNKKLQDLGEKFKDLKAKHAAQKTANTFADFVDNLTVFGRPSLGFEEFKGESVFDFLMHIEDMVKKSFQSKYRTDAEWDFSCYITLHPIKSGQILGILFEQGSVPQYKKVFDRQTFVRDYHYQNSTDKPSKITTHQWNNRKKHWDEVFPSNKSSAPAQRGASFTLASEDYPLFDIYAREAKHLFFKYLPTLEERKAKCFKSFVEHQYYQTEEAKTMLEEKRWMEMFRQCDDFVKKNQDSYKSYFEEHYAPKFVDLETVRKDGFKSLEKGHLNKV